MAFMQKMHTFMGKIDPVVRWADKKNLTPSFLYPLPKPDAPINRPVTQAGKAAERAGQTPPAVEGVRRRRAADVLGSRGLLAPR